MSIRIKSVCLNQPSDSFLYISSFCPPLYSRSIPLIFFSREILRLSSSKVRHIYYIGLYNIILHYPTFTRSSQVPYLSKVNFFCCSVSVIVTSGGKPSVCAFGTATSPFRGGCDHSSRVHY